MEATGHSRWFERLLAELGFELWIGDPAEIKAKRVKKQKFDREDARLLLRLLRENNFPQIWVPVAENRDLRQPFATGYVLTIEDPHRFRKSRDAGCFVGLQPGRRNSGESETTDAHQQRGGRVSTDAAGARSELHFRTLWRRQ